MERILSSKRKLSVLAFSTIILFCILPFQADARKKNKQKGDKGKDAQLIQTEKEGVPSRPVADKEIKKNDTINLDLPVSQWLGKKFRLLRKTKIFQKFGYELYTSPKFSEETLPPDTTIELSNHRIKYNLFKCKTVSAIDVKEMSNKEYVIVFKTDTMDLTLYGKTRNGIIEGLAFDSDLKSAEKRWKGKKIYSKRRCIDIFDSSSSSFTSIKVSIAEPLLVGSINWGIVPLPPKSLWLVVERLNGARGIIPVNYSWTNVPKNERTTGMPWDEDIFEKNPRDIYQWEEYVWEIIDKHNIFTGMTTQQVLFSWGRPNEIRSEKFAGTEKKCIYFYDGKKLHFVNDTLTSTSE